MCCCTDILQNHTQTPHRLDKPIQTVSAVVAEGGMSEFCAYTEQEWALRQWLKARDGHVTVEGVVSGPGLTNVYEFLQQQEQQ